MVADRGWRREDAELVFNGDRVSVLQDEEFWRWMVLMLVQQYDT